MITNSYTKGSVAFLPAASVLPTTKNWWNRACQLSSSHPPGNPSLYYTQMDKKKAIDSCVKNLSSARFTIDMLQKQSITQSSPLCYALFAGKNVARRSTTATNCM